MTAGRLAAQGNPIHASVLFPQETPLTTAATLQPYLISVIVVDLTGDGLADVVAISQFPGMVAWYQNTGNGTFGPSASHMTANDGRIRRRDEIHPRSVRAEVARKPLTRPL